MIWLWKSWSRTRYTTAATNDAYKVGFSFRSTPLKQLPAGTRKKKHPLERRFIWVFPKIGVPQNGWFIMENPIKIHDLGVPLFLGNTHIPSSFILGFHVRFRGSIRFPGSFSSTPGIPGFSARRVYADAPTPCERLPVGQEASTMQNTKKSPSSNLYQPSSNIAKPKTQCIVQ